MYIKNFCCRTNVPFSISHSLASGITSKINGSKLALQILTNNMTDFRKHTVFTHKKKDINFFFFRERGGKEEEKERNIFVYDQLPLTHPQLGTWPATQANVLTGNRTSDLSVQRPVLSPLSHSIQGKW